MFAEQQENGGFNSKIDNQNEKKENISHVRTDNIGHIRQMRTNNTTEPKGA